MGFVLICLIFEPGKLKIRILNHQLQQKRFSQIGPRSDKSLSLVVTKNGLFGSQSEVNSNRGLL